MKASNFHFVEYAIEAAGLGLFMVSAVVFSHWIFDPVAPLLGESPGLARLLMGLAMGGTCLALVYSRFGKRSGAHFNPAVTLSFFRLGRIRGGDALGYIGAQFTGAVLGVYLTKLSFSAGSAATTIEPAVTRPGAAGGTIAFVAELAISFVLFATVLYASSHRRLEKATGLLAAILVCLYITFEAPLSGMSMNPARSFGSALVAGDLSDLWIYLLAPPLGMLLAAEFMLRILGRGAVLCAKLHHRNDQPCIFVCDYDPSRLLGAARTP